MERVNENSRIRIVGPNASHHSLQPLSCKSLVEIRLNKSEDTEGGVKSQKKSTPSRVDSKRGGTLEK